MFKRNRPTIMWTALAFLMCLYSLRTHGAANKQRLPRLGRTV